MSHWKNGGGTIIVSDALEARPFGNCEKTDAIFWQMSRVVSTFNAVLMADKGLVCTKSANPKGTLAKRLRDAGRMHYLCENVVKKCYR